MDQRSIEKHLRRWHRREKPNPDPVGGETDRPERMHNQGRMHNPMTDGGLPVADQLCKEWDPRRGGLPVFLRTAL